MGNADDVIILDETSKGAQIRHLDCIKAFKEAGLEVFMEKQTVVQPCVKKHETLHIDDDSITRNASITFVGTVLEFGGHHARAWQYRLG